MKVLQLENISKRYKLGELGTKSFLKGIKDGLWRMFGRHSAHDVVEVNDREVSGGTHVWALQNINFNVNQGEVVGIVGRNGAGKSTLLKLLSRVTGPTTGEIRVKGRMASLLEVGTGFHPELTGRENIFLNGAILGMKRPEIESKFDEIVAFSGVAKYVDTPVKRYSSGMYVRLAFAIAAHLEPEIMIIDEVLAVGDVDFQKKCIAKMKEIAASGRTILFVSHNMASVRDLCTRCILLDKGGVIADGDTESVVQQYLTGGYSETSFGQVPDDYPRNAPPESKLKIEYVDLLNEGGQPASKFFYKEEVTIRVRISTTEELGTDFVCLSSFGDQFHERITYQVDGNDIHASGQTEIGKGVFEICMKTKPSLLPGNYHVNFTILDRMGYPYDGITCFGSFDVDQLGKEPELKYNWSKRIGLVAVENSTTINKII